MKPVSSHLVHTQVEIFKQNLGSFEALQQVVMAALKDVSRQVPGVLIVEGRVKAISSFAEKCLRKRKRYDQPAWQLTDLCGARVIVTSKEAIAPVCRRIEEYFDIDENEDTALRLGQMEFGYQSVHFIVSLGKEKEALYRKLQPEIPEALFQRRDSQMAQESGLPIGPIFKAEIQVRTLLQHAWAVMIHDNLYKTELKVKPKHLVRESGRMAALLEDADESFLKLLQDIRQYESYYGAYLTPAEILDEIAVQRAILPHDPGNRSIALKIARLADTLGDPGLVPGVEADLAQFAHLEDADVQRELGMVRFKLGIAEGRDHLLKATQLDPANPDNWCELGRTYYQETNYWKALQAYEQGFRAAPQNPRVLLRYIECRILERADFSFIPLIRHNLEQAVEISRQQIAAGMNIPWAWYDIGFFQLLLGLPYLSLDAYSRAVRSTHSVGLVETVYQSLTRLQQKAAGVEPNLATHLNWVRSFLKVVLVGRFSQPAQNHLYKGDQRLDGYSALTSCAAQSGKNPFRPGTPVVIVAGECSAGWEKLALDYGPLLRFGFEGFAGIVCSGGTRAGISGLIGDLPDPAGTIQKLAYLPSGHPARDAEHSAYMCVCTTEGTYSPLDTIILWSDLIAAQVNPDSVRLLGIGGGNLSAFEYRLALLLGANVGVLSASGHAALEISLDPQWLGPDTLLDGSGKAHLLRLPNDPETVRAFLQPPPESRLIDPQKRLQMAMQTHENYRGTSIPALVEGRAELAPWKTLDETFKSANLSQIDDIEAKLKRLNLTLKETTPDQDAPLYEFDAAQVELLAEMEHGRWVVERLRDGWTYGEERDNEKKIRPQLIAWRDLPEDEKEKDRIAVRDIPGKLAAAGFQIIDPRSGSGN